MPFSRKIFVSAVVISLLASAVSVTFAASGDTEQSLEARITAITPSLCGRDRHACSQIDLAATSGPLAGKAITIRTDPLSFVGGRPISLKDGQSILLETQTIDGQQHFVFSDLVRRMPLSFLLAIFIGCIVLVGGRSSVRSLLGMVVSFVFLFAFMLPRILAGDSPLLIGFLGSCVIMTLTFLITHGWNAKMGSALLGTFLSLLLTAALAISFSAWAHLLGLADENAVYLLQNFPHLDTRGLLLAGIIIGTLGSLNDVTISQASAVFELKAANPRLTSKELNQSALRIGRDHIAGAINTLILAYAGVALPLLLLLVSSSNAEPWSILVNRETFATEIVRTLVGSIGLLAAIPFTNLFASFFAGRMDFSRLKEIAGGGHGH
ncbi:YibE/F family protein [Candidatus Peregrinibacteria bacterium]|nr:YibE/F family protein [Candidatus Peregrinibacteria bacterium]